jgi:hypothetical protein
VVFLPSTRRLLDMVAWQYSDQKTGRLFRVFPREETREMTFP